MSRLEIILSAIMFISIVLNIGLIVYARNIIEKLFAVSNELYDLGKMVDSFTEHIESVYELEMFYGDQTLQYLLDHARSFNEQMDTFEFIYQYADEDTNEKLELIDDNEK